MRSSQSGAVAIPFALIWLTPLVASDALHIYIDADRTGCREAGLSIERGVRTALSEVDSTVGGRRVEVLLRDHRGNSRRSRMHLEEFVSDERGLVVIAGLHSPPLLANLDFINENGILVLDPWAAAGPITRGGTGDSNWVFRLSVDDTKAGHVIARSALAGGEFRRPHLLLEKTGWGRSNLATMTAAVQELGLEPPPVTWFNWNVGDHRAKVILQNILDRGADVIFFVGNTPEGKIFARAMLDLPESKRVPILSHWGITGNDFAESLGPESVAAIDLRFIQTSSSFLSKPLSAHARGVLERAKELFPDAITAADDIHAPAGFIHAYDLTRILIAAASQAGLTDESVPELRRRTRAALLDLETPVEGLVKRYRRPFSPFGPNNPDGHEALSTDDFVMARYRPDGRIVLEPADAQPTDSDEH